MPDEINDTEQTEETQAEGQETEETTDEQGGDDAPEMTVDDLKKVIKSLRGENAGWRTQLRDAQAQLKNAKTPEEFAAAIADVESKVAAKDRELVIVKYKLPDDLAELLPTGLSAEDLEAKAKALAKYAPTSDEEDRELSGGLKPGTGEDKLGPRELAKRAQRRNYR